MVRRTMRRVAYEADGWGRGVLWLDGHCVVNHELPRPGVEETVAPDPLGERLAAYFAGDRVSFEEVELELDWCTPFQRAVLDVLRGVPYGETVTYGELAALAGYPHAARAAGTVCARNRFPLLVPCHRVVGAAGLGRFGTLGVGYKQRLLALEGAV